MKSSLNLTQIGQEIQETMKGGDALETLMELKKIRSLLAQNRVAIQQLDGELLAKPEKRLAEGIELLRIKKARQ